MTIAKIWLQDYKMTLEEQLRDSLLGKDVELTKLLISMGADVNHKEFKGPGYRERMGAMELALLNNKANHFDALINAGIKIEATTVHYGKCMVSKLVVNTKCTVDHVKLFLEETQLKGPNVSRYSRDNPLLSALEQRHIKPEIIECLIDTIPLLYDMPEEKYSIYWDLLMISARHGNVEVLKTLFKYDQGLGETLDEKLNKTLKSAIRAKRSTNIQWLIDKGAKLRDGDFYALHSAGEVNSEKVISVLLKNGCQVDEPNHKGLTCLMIASRKSTIKAINGLLDNGSDINARDPQGRAALHYAILANSQVIITLLVERGANKDCQDNNGVTPLMLATAKLKDEHVDTLITLGANIDAVDNEGKTALFYRPGDNETDILVSLLEAGSDIDHVDNNGNTPLLDAVNKKHIEALRVLIYNNADVTIINNKGQSAVDILNRKRTVDNDLRLIIEMIELKSMVDQDDYDSPGL